MLVSESSVSRPTLERIVGQSMRRNGQANPITKSVAPTQRRVPSAIGGTCPAT